MNGMNKKTKLIIILTAAALTLAASVVMYLFYYSPRFLERPKLAVHFIDVGQGDSTLLESKGEFVLIDAGEKEYGGKVVDYIESCGANRLKYVIATHPHTDHIGGLAEVISSIKTENFITVETDQSTSAWRKVLETVDDTGAKYIDAEPGAVYTFGDASLTVLAPLSDDYDGYNNYSVVTKAVCGDISFMLTGDAEKKSEQEMLDAGFDLSADVLKCGHHGSSTSSTAKFLKAVDPDYAVISCGKDNDYGHPNTETLKKISLLGCLCLRTDELGTIVAETDGVTLSFSSEKGSIPDIDPKLLKAGEYYVGNKNSRVFHSPDCSSVSSMSEKNKVLFGSREQALEEGYLPCALCDP